MADKVDFKRQLDCYKARVGKFQVVEVPRLRYLMIDGHGDPNTEAFSEAVSSLFPVAYKLKFASKKTLQRDYVVMPLEGLWWAQDMSSFTAHRNKADWDWTLMIMVPDWITSQMFQEVIDQLATKSPPPLLNNVRLEELSEGMSVQTLHIGSFDDEGETLAEMHSQFIPENGLKMTGKHHEIYLSDFRKVETAKLRTIFRQPVERI